MDSNTFSIRRRGGFIALACTTLFLNFAPVQAHTEAVTDDQVTQAVSAVDAMAQKAIDDKTLVGLAVAVVHKDKLVFAKGYGWREVGTDQKVDADTVFQLASVSKPISSTVVAELVGEGKITWDSKISDLDSSFQMLEPWVSREITLRDFYCHRSGLPDHAGDLLEDIGYDREQVLHRLRYQRPDSSFRSHYAYTNFGLTEAAVAATKKYGMTWETAAEEKLFKPLQMTSTSARFSDFIARPNRALGHVLVDGKWTQKYRRQPDAQSPAGGVSSSVNDMSKWMRLQLSEGKFEGRRIVAESALAETHKPHMLTMFSPVDGLPAFYGLGIGVNYDMHGRLRLSHSGAFALGAATSVSMIPKDQLGIVVLTNCYPIGFAESVSNTFMDVALEGKPSRDWFALFKKVFADPATLGLSKTYDYSKVPAVQAPALPNAAYLGKYTNDLFGDIAIVDQSGGLAIVLGPQKTVLPMQHYNRDVFSYLPVGENADGRSGITFQVDADGKAGSVVVEDLNGEKQGTFTRVK